MKMPIKIRDIARGRIFVIRIALRTIYFGLGYFQDGHSPFLLWLYFLNLLVFGFDLQIVTGRKFASRKLFSSSSPGVKQLGKAKALARITWSTYEC